MLPLCAQIHPEVLLVRVELDIMATDSHVQVKYLLNASIVSVVFRVSRMRVPQV